MDEYTEIYFIDEDDLRNASRDHRSQTSMEPRRPVLGRRPAPMPVAVRSSQASRGRPVAVVAQPAPEPERKLLGGMTVGQLVELAAQLLAAMQPLPGAPAAQGQVETDVENLMTYQNALAIHAKRDEQLRTIGALVAALVK